MAQKIGANTREEVALSYTMATSQRHSAHLQNSKKPKTDSADLTKTRNGSTLKPAHCGKLAKKYWHWHKITIEGAGMFPPLKIAVLYRDFIFYILQKWQNKQQKNTPASLGF